MHSFVRHMLLAGLLFGLALVDTAAAQRYQPARSRSYGYNNYQPLMNEPPSDLPPPRPWVPDETPFEEPDAEQPGEQPEGTTPTEEPDPYTSEFVPNQFGPNYDDERLNWDEKCGYCGDPGCVTCRHWFVLPQVALLHRTRARRITLTTQPEQVTQPTTPPTVVTVFPSRFTTRTGAFNLEPGMSLTMGRYLGRDVKNRDHMVEITWLDFLEWNTGAAFNGTPTPFTVPDPNDPNQVLTFSGGDLISPFGLFARGFSQAFQHSTSYSSRMHDIQINYRLQRGLRRDRLMYLPGGWTPKVTPGLTPSVIFGPRFIQINEAFGYFSVGTITDGVTSTNFSGQYTTSTHNQLFGGQVGLDATQQFDDWSYGVQLRTGLFENFAEQNSLIQVQDNVAFKANNPPINTAVSADARDLVFLGNLNFSFSARVTRRMTFHANYGMMWLVGLALAPEQLQFESPLLPTINTNGTIMFQGGNLGLEWVF